MFKHRFVPILAAAALAVVPFVAHAGVVAVGRNAEGQAAVPANLAVEDVVAISAGRRHSVALLADGSVQAWGQAADNRLVVPVGLRAGAIDAGAWHTLAVTTDGRAVGWGFNASGVLDIPSALTDGSRRVIAVSAGDFHSLALLADGTVVGWGSNVDGRARAPFGLAGVIGLSAGGSHSLALKRDGTVVAWGANDDGQCDVPAGLTGVVAISAGGGHSVALRNDGAVVGWGRNLERQIDVIENAVAISAGERHTLAVTASGRAVSVGENSEGQRNLPSGAGVVLVSGGGLHSLAVTGGGPAILEQPRSQTVLPGSEVTLSVAAAGANGFQWYFNNEVIDGANLPTLTIPGISHTRAGAYSVLVAGDGGSTRSGEALVAVRSLLRVAAPETLADGTIRLTFGDALGAPLAWGVQTRFTVQTSSDLLNWSDTDIELVWSDGLALLEDAAEDRSPARFYRVVEK